MCEEIFSESVLTLTKYRKWLLPVYLETLLFLKGSIHMYDAALFYKLH